MLIGKKTTEEPKECLPRRNIITVNPKLMKYFSRMSSALLESKDRRLPDLVEEFLNGLILHTEPTELVEFALIHNQERLHRTLREFVRLKMPAERLEVQEIDLFLDIASQFLTQAYCIYHDAHNQRHTNNIWSYRLCLELSKVFRPFERKVEETGSTSEGDDKTSRDLQSIEPTESYE